MPAADAHIKVAEVPAGRGATWLLTAFDLNQHIGLVRWYTEIGQIAIRSQPLGSMVAVENARTASPGQGHRRNQQLDVHRARRRDEDESLSRHNVVRPAEVLAEGSQRLEGTPQPVDTQLPAAWRSHLMDSADHQPVDLSIELAHAPPTVHPLVIPRWLVSTPTSCSRFPWSERQTTSRTSAKWQATG